jgi:Ras GTPase-activating-like protein IQGAP2/3
MRALQKKGKVPRFGSYKYTAEQLVKKGALVSVGNYLPKQYDRIALTLSSEEVGIIKVECLYFGIQGEDIEIRLEDLLQCQYDGKQEETFHELVINVNLMLYLINRK